MRNTHQKALAKSVKMLGRALKASWTMQNMHDKPGNLPDLDIFALDKRVRVKRIEVIIVFILIGRRRFE